MIPRSSFSQIHFLRDSHATCYVPWALWFRWKVAFSCTYRAAFRISLMPTGPPVRPVSDHSSGNTSGILCMLDKGTTRKAPVAFFRNIAVCWLQGRCAIQGKLNSSRWWHEKYVSCPIQNLMYGPRWIVTVILAPGSLKQEDFSDSKSHCEFYYSQSAGLLGELLGHIVSIVQSFSKSETKLS